MSSLFARLLASFRDGGNGRRRACYGVAVIFVWMLLFGMLAVTGVRVWKAFAFSSFSLAAFGVLCGCTRTGRSEGGAGVELELDSTPTAAACRFGLAAAAIHALPTFAYASGGGDLESAASDGDMCSVCLEDLQGGELVRRLPACGHMFHVECIDMWLHSHRTCPMCRHDLSPPPQKTEAKVATVEPEPPADDDALPPVQVRSGRL